MLLVEVVRCCLLFKSTVSWDNGGASELVFVGFVLSDAVALGGKTDESDFFVLPLKTIFIFYKIKNRIHFILG